MQEDLIYDYIIIGSGPAGTIAALTLVQAKAKVLMLDVGHKDEKYQQLVPAINYDEIRRTIQNQSRFFLGDEMEAIPNQGVKVGAQLSPSRKAMIKEVEKWIPLHSNTFNPMESLGYGGLGAGWGLGAYVYSEAECQRVGLPFDELMQSYQFTADHIGISVGKDALQPYLSGSLERLQPALKMDNAAQKLLKRSEKDAAFFTANNMFFGTASMALLTEDKEKRKATAYYDTDFYADLNQSAYRPQFTLDELRKESNFDYLGKHLAIYFIDNHEYTIVNTLQIETDKSASFKAKKLILAAGALGTARLVLRSFPQLNQLPVLSNPYAYLPGIQFSMLGKKLDPQKSSMAQAMMIYDPDGKKDNFVSLAFYTYQSLMLFRLIKESPLNIADNRLIFQYLQSAFIIAGIHHPDSMSPQKWLRLESDRTSKTGDHLFVHYQLTDDEKARIHQREKTIRKAIYKLGILPIKRIDPGAGSSIHYGGTIPFSDKDELGKQAHSGRLYNTRNVYIADSAGFNFLPAKGVTLSIMANAHRVTSQLLKR
jgi:choline dehydrogenase-like flavoprotein